MRSLIFFLLLLITCFAPLSARAAEPDTVNLAEPDSTRATEPDAVSVAEPVSARDAEPDAVMPPVRGRLVFYFENDLFYNTDKYYTNAVQFRYISSPLRSRSSESGLPGALDGLDAESPTGVHPGKTQYNYSFGMGQAIYTPKDTASYDLQRHDRPYAGYLYGFFALHAKQHRIMDTAELSLGVVGPSALGEFAQNEVHRIRGFKTAKGWKHQLRDEPALMLSWSRHYRLNADAGQAGWGWDVLPYHTLTAGNVLTQVAVGTEVRLGYNLPRDFSSSSIRPGSGVDAPSDNPAHRRKPGEWGWYLFAGTEGRAVAHNIFLDGNTWKSSHHIAKNPFVGDINAGMAVLIGDVRVTYNHVYVTEEFKRQTGGGQNYGSISVTVPF